MIQSLNQALWAIQLALLAFLGIVLISKKAWRNFPFFTVYSLFNLGSGLVEFLLYKSPRVYVYAYIVIEILSVFLGLAVVYEIFVQLFSSHAALRKLATSLLSVVMALLIALGAAVIYRHAPGLKNVISAVLVSEEAARALEVGMLVFLFICSSAFGLQWRHTIFGIALGLGVFTTVQLTIMTLWKFIVHTGGDPLLGIIGLLAFNLSLFIWIGYLLVAEPKPVASELPDKSQLEQWNRAVMELIHQ